jgi:hypothetical protein
MKNAMIRKEKEEPFSRIVVFMSATYTLIAMNQFSNVGC